MIIEEIKNIKSDKKELRKFGVTVGIVLILISLLFLFVWNNETVFTVLSISGSVLIFFGILLPKVLFPVHKIWMAFAVVLGFIMTRIILSILFYIIVTLVGMIAKIFRKDFLDKRIDKNKKSYWHQRETIAYTKELTERQF